MDEAPTARRFALKFGLVLAGLALVVTVAILALRPPRLVWGSQYLDPAMPRNYAGYQAYGATDFEEFRLGVSGNRHVRIFVPPDGSRNTGWPRLTGRRRDIVPNQQGEQEIELYPP